MAAIATATRRVAPAARHVRTRFGRASRFRRPVDGPTAMETEPRHSLAFAVVKPYDHNDSLLSMVLPWRVQRRGPDVYSLLCVRADERAGTSYDGVSDASFADAAADADNNQVRMEGGNMWLSLPRFENVTSARGDHDDAKLRPSAVVAVAIDPYDDPFNAGLLGSAAALFGNAGHGVIDYHPNPLQAVAAVESVRDDGSVDIVAAGVFRSEWSGFMRQLAPPLHPVAEALSFGAATARAEYAARQPVESYRANVDRSRVVAHASFRNVFLVTTLEDVRTDVCLLWPRAVDVDDVRFVDATTGAPLPDAALRTTTFRRWLDGEVRLSVAGVDVSVCDPTGCLPRGWW